MDSVKRAQTMLENEPIGGAHDRVRAKVDRADHTIVGEVPLDSREEGTRSTNPTGGIGRPDRARELEASDLAGDYRLALSQEQAAQFDVLVLIGEVSAKQCAAVRVQETHSRWRGAASASLAALPRPRVVAIAASWETSLRGRGTYARRPRARRRARTNWRSSCVSTALRSSSLTIALTDRPWDAARFFSRRWRSSSIRVMS